MVSELTKQIVLKETRSEAENFWLCAELDGFKYTENVLVSQIESPSGNWCADERGIESLYIKIRSLCFNPRSPFLSQWFDYTSDINAIFRVLSKLGQADLKLGGEIWLCRFISYLELPMATASTFWTIKEMLKKAEKPQQLFTALAETIAAMRRKELKLEKTDEHN